MNPIFIKNIYAFIYYLYILHIVLHSNYVLPGNTCIIIKLFAIILCFFHT